MVDLESRIPPPAVGAIVAAMMWGLAMIGPGFVIEAGLKQVLVGVLVMIGITFDVLGILAFRASRTTISPLTPERSSSLVTGGIYRITRNPMYVGMVFFLLAWAIYLSALLPLAGIVLFVVYITRFQIRPEERALGRIFGEKYRAYCSRARRWI